MAYLDGYKKYYAAILISISLSVGRINLSFHSASTIDGWFDSSLDYIRDAPVTQAFLKGEKKNVSISDYDLTIWSTKPLPGDLIFTRGIPIDTQDEYLQKMISMEQVLTVDFRLCRSTDNAEELSLPPCRYFSRNEVELDLNQWQVKGVRKYNENIGRVLNIYYPIMNVTIKERRHLLKSVFDVTKAATVWSSELKQHVSLHYLWNYTYLRTCKVLKDSREACPKACEENIGGENQAYPYMLDTFDFTCKSSHPSTLPPIRPFGGSCNLKTTCFTPEASALNSTWPWKDEKERSKFYPNYYDEKIRKKVRQELQNCHKMRHRKPQSSYEARFACTSQSKAPCPIYGAFEHHLFFIPKAKLIFCGIPKNGMTEWIKFFRYQQGSKDYLAKPHSKVDRYHLFMSRLSIDKARNILNDPNWTRAVFIRNPYERLLSSYMDKIVGENYGGNEFNMQNMSFEEFVDAIADTSTLDNCKDPKGLDVCSDPHWRPQIAMCGLDYLLPKFNFIANFNHIAEHSKLLLEKVGLWEEYGKTFDDGKDTILQQTWAREYSSPAPKRLPNETMWGFNQRGPSRVDRHRIHSTNSKTFFQEYYTPELMETVRKLYDLDFKVWDELSSTKMVANGRQLKVVQEYCKDERRKHVGGDGNADSDVD